MASIVSRILTGELVTREAVRNGSLNKTPLDLPLSMLWLGAFYGACVGLFAVTHAHDQLPLRFITCVIKVPLLYMLTVVVTLPSLYVLGALVGVKLSFRALLTLVLSMVTVTTAVLASLGPVVALFAFASSSYAFFVLLDIAVHVLASIIGVASLARSMRRVVAAEVEEMYGMVAARHSYLRALAQKVKIPPGDLAGPLDKDELPENAPPPAPVEDDPDLLSSPTTLVFYLYLAVFILVSVQLSWMLRPMVGDPAAAWSWLRTPGDSFGTGLMRVISATLGGPS